MKILKWVGVVASALALVACGGGGGDAGTSPFVPEDPTDSGATSIEVLASSVQVGSGGDEVTITAIVKGAGNVSLDEAPVTFSTNSGTLTSASTETDAAGVATAQLSPGADKSNRTITITVTSGAISGSIDVAVVGTTLTYSGNTTVTLGDETSATVQATDSKGAVISGLEVTVASSLDNGLSATSITTNSLGVATVDYTATNSGTDELSFSGGGANTEAEIQISGEDFTFVSPAANTTITVGDDRNLTVRYLSGGLPQAGRTVSFAATAGTLSQTSAVTNASGEATVSISAATASPATVQASLVGVTAQATLPIRFVAETPDTLVLQVSPTAIGPNPAGATAQQARVLATVTDANGNPVQGATVNFNRTADPSGGDLSQASQTTDSAGQASVQFIAGPTTTASNGVQIRATVASDPTVFGDATLTVNQSALFIALGTGNVITNIDEQTYQKDWVVYVTDSNGIAVPGIDLTIKVLPSEYGKGNLTFISGWTYANNVNFCPNEDVNFNGVLDAGEDTNNSGTLEPGNVISVTPGTVETDENGRATISLIYAESYAPWVEVTLRAEAVVSGTESSKEALFIVVGEAGDFSSEDNPPAGVESPFGVNDCGIPN